MGPPDLVVVSNRGPLTLTSDGAGRQIVTRGGGGLVSSLGPVVSGAGATWVSAVRSGDGPDGGAVLESDGFRVRPVRIDPDRYRQYYDVVANSTLWYLHHHLFDLARRPLLDRRWREAWRSFREVNRAFAEAVADEAADGATVIVHDYHLALMGTELARLRPDLRTAHFHHTPFCGPETLAVLPDDVATQLLQGMAGFGSCGFHAARWASAFATCGASLLGRVPATFVSPAAVDAEELGSVGRSAECERDLAALDDQVGDRMLVARVDRIELSKNIVRGFLAFDELLRVQPRWRERVVFGAFVYPSRETLPDYIAYRNEVETVAARVNREWATPGWTPIMLDTSDHFTRSVAALRRYDVLLVNPVRDGLNLVAKEGFVLNERDGVVALSREAGAWDELQGAALGVNPFDVAGTAEVLATALDMDGAERARRAAAGRAASEARTSAGWLADQLRHAAAPARPASG